MNNYPKTDMTLFEDYQIRRVYRVYDEDGGIWWLSVIDIVRMLTQQDDYQIVRKYWNKLKQRLKEEGSQLVTNCHQLKLTAADGKQRMADVATAETLLRLVQSVPSPKAEPIKLWLAKVSYESMQEMADPEKINSSLGAIIKKVKPRQFMYCGKIFCCQCREKVQYTQQIFSLTVPTG